MESREELVFGRKRCSFLIYLFLGVSFLIFCVTKIKAPALGSEAYIKYVVESDFSTMYNIYSEKFYLLPYVFCLKVWAMMFGAGAASLRFMSVFFSLVSSIFLFQIFRRVFSEKKSLVFVALYFIILAASGLGWRISSFSLYFATFSIFSFLVYILYVARKKWAKIFWAVFLGVAAIFLVAGCMNRAETYDISGVLSEVISAAGNEEAILAGDADVFLATKFYRNDGNEVLIFADKLGRDVKSRVVNMINKAVVYDKTEFLKQHNSFWYIVKNSKDGAKSQVPEEFLSYQISSEISLDDFSALEFRK